MTSTSKPLTCPVASIDIDFVARTITLTSLLGDVLTLPVDPRGVQNTIVSPHDRPKVTVPVTNSATTM